MCIRDRTASRRQKGACVVKIFPSFNTDVLTRQHGGGSEQDRHPPHARWRQEHPRLRFAPMVEFTAFISSTWSFGSCSITEALSIEAVVLFDGLGHVPGARHSLACEGARGLHSKFSCKRNNSVFLLHWLNWTYLWENSHVSRLDPYRFATIRCDCDLALAERV